MANTMRWRYGDTNPVILQVGEESNVEIGDLIYHDGSFARPAGEVVNVVDFAEQFVGVAMQASPWGESKAIRIGTSGVFEFDCDERTWTVGESVRPTFVANGDEMVVFPQSVRGDREPAVSIGLCAKSETKPVSKVLIDIKTRIGRQMQGQAPIEPAV